MAQLGKYELIRKIATGGMAEVFLARAAGPMGFEKTLVLKRILPHLAEDQTFVEMFLGEAKLAAQLNHPNLVQIFDFGESDGQFFIAMELIDGPNLRALSRRATELRQPIPVALAAKAISFAAEGLAYAHDFADPATGEPLNLIHRDISPDNILLGRNGAVKVVDFGIAKAANSNHHTKTGTLKGKLAYMPPEQLQSKPLDRRADVFALGMVLYELLTGAKPFDATSEVSIMQAILYEPLLPAVSRRPDVPAPMQAILERALAKDREQRYPGCRALQTDLERFILSTGEPVGAFQLSTLVKELAAPSPNPSATPAAGSAPRSRPGTPAPPPAPAPTQAFTGIDVELRTAMSGPPAPPPAPAAPPPAPAVTGAVAARRSSRAPLLAAAAGAVLLLAGGAFVVSRRAPPPAVPQPSPAPVPAEAKALAPTPTEAPAPVAAAPAPAAPSAAATQPEPAAAPAEPPPAMAELKPELKPEPKRERDRRTRTARERTKPAEKAQAPLVVAAREAQPEEKATPEPLRASFRVETVPPAQVRVNGKFAGASPVTVSGLAPGEVEVEVYDSLKGIRKQQRFSLSGGDNGVKRIVVAPGTLEFRVRPYATVMLDDRSLGQTPFDAVKVYEGRHTIRLINRDLGKDISVPFEVKPGANVFKYNLSE